MTLNYKGAALDDIRSGIRMLKDSGVKLFSLNGEQMVDKLVDESLEPMPTRVVNFFTGLGFDGELGTHLIADAPKSEGLPAVLYIASLYYGALRVTGGMGVVYRELPQDERKKLAVFLYRPAQERRLPIQEKNDILYPDLKRQIEGKAGDIDWALNYNQDGLARILRCLIESKGATEQTEQDVIDRWRIRGWEKYLTGKGDVKVKNNLLRDERKADFLIADFNSPEAIELILGDIRTLVDNPYNLLAILHTANVVLPRRNELAAQRYFDRETKEPDRVIMLEGLLSQEIDL